MHNEFMAIIGRDGEWFISYCPEVPGANGQGKTKDEARESLAQAVSLILEDRRENGLRGVPPDAVCETSAWKTHTCSYPLPALDGLVFREVGSMCSSSTA